MADMLAQTDSITLITGKPGSGKTLRAVRFIREAVEKGEQVFVCNLTGLKLPHIPLANPHEWQTLPPGSVLVVDEAQQFFRARRGGEPPAYIQAMETIRHAGIRLLLMTQQPDYLDAHIRGLVGLHEHLVREHGKPAAKIWRHTEVMENVRSDRARAKYDQETWPYDVTLYPLYESAEVHTVKKIMSARWKRGLMFLGAAVVLLIGGAYLARNSYNRIGGDSPVPDLDGAHQRAVVPVPGSPPSSGSEVRTIEEYAAMLTPRIGEAPWSAPIYDERGLTVDPTVICAIAQPGRDSLGKHRGAECACMTEQGTPYIMADDEQRSGDARCRHVARWGQPYNPFKQQRHDAGQQQAMAAMPTEPGA
jgi:hypothetical protein